MIASSSPALKSTSMMASSYHVDGSSVSPDASSHTEASLSPLGTQSHSPVAIVRTPTSLQTSPIVNGNCQTLLQAVKLQGDSSLATQGNSISNVEMSQEHQYIIPTSSILAHPYMPPQYNGAIPEGIKNEENLQNQAIHLMSYQSLQAVTSETGLATHGPSMHHEMVTSNQNVTLAPMPFVTTHLSNQNGIGGLHPTSPSSQPFIQPNDNTSKTIFVQMENGEYQAVPVYSDINGNANATAAQLTNATTLPQQFCSSNLVSRHHGKEGAQRESAKEKPKTGPYRTSRCSLCSAVMEEFLAFRFANRTRKKYVK